MLYLIPATSLKHKKGSVIEPLTKRIIDLSLTTKKNYSSIKVAEVYLCHNLNIKQNVFALLTSLAYNSAIY